MALDPKRVTECYQALLELARNRKSRHSDELITYGELAERIKVVPPSIGRYLDAVYCQEVEGRDDVPDLTVLCVPKGKRHGPFNSRGKQVRSVRVDPNDPEALKAYNKELDRVTEYWGSR